MASYHREGCSLISDATLVNETQCMAVILASNIFAVYASLVKKKYLPLKTLSNTGLDFWSKLIACLVLHQHMYKSKLPSFFGKRTLYFYQKGKLWNFGVSK